jgi:hypothetical protein
MPVTNFPDGITTNGSSAPVLGMIVQGVTLSPVAVAANTTAEQAFAVPGVSAGDVVLAVNKPTEQAGLGIAGQRVVSTGTIGITFANVTAAAITPTAAEVYQVATVTP